MGVDEQLERVVEETSERIVERVLQRVRERLAEIGDDDLFPPGEPAAPRAPAPSSSGSSRGPSIIDADDVLLHPRPAPPVSLLPPLVTRAGRPPTRTMKDALASVTSLLRERPGLTPAQIGEALGWPKNTYYRVLLMAKTSGVLRTEAPPGRGTSAEHYFACD